MKRYQTFTALVVILTSASLFTSCASSGPAAAATPATAPAKAASPLVISDFEDASKPIATFAGPKSSVKVEYQGELVHGGKLALKVTEFTSDWSGALIEFKGPQAALGDWNGYSKLHFWVYGTKTGQSSFIDLEDAGAEQFRFTLTNDFEGWKEFVVPFEDFGVRTDYQAANARRNGKLEFPLMTLQFFTASQFKGSLVFDDISIEP